MGTDGLLACISLLPTRALGASGFVRTWPCERGYCVYKKTLPQAAQCTLDTTSVAVQWHSRQPHLLAGAIKRAAGCFGCTQHVQHGDTDTDNCSSEKPQPDWRRHGAGLRRPVLVCNCQMSVVAQSAIKTDGCATAGQRRARADGVASAGAPRPCTLTSWSSVCTVGEVDLASSRRNCCGHGVT